MLGELNHVMNKKYFDLRQERTIQIIRSKSSAHHAWKEKKNPLEAEGANKLLVSKKSQLLTFVEANFSSKRIK